MTTPSPAPTSRRLRPVPVADAAPGGPNGPRGARTTPVTGARGTA
jgi:hypothetical protein